MCEKCFQTGIVKFESYTAFDEFEKILDEKIRLGIFKIETERLEENHYNSIYHCVHCSEKWLLSDPDNSWRGYFLPENEAHIYERKVDTDGKIRWFGCTNRTGLISV